METAHSSPEDAKPRRSHESFGRIAIKEVFRVAEIVKSGIIGNIGRAAMWLARGKQAS